MKNWIKFFNNRKVSAGFTLIELLVAASITSIVVSIAGTGLVSMISADKEAKSQNDRRVELNRALDFIADEVRQARYINRISAPVASRPSTTDTIETGTLQPILVLELPNAAQPIVYNIAKPHRNTVWRGPRVIYRWGPTFNNGTSNLNDSSAWRTQPLVDLVESSEPDPNPVCSNSWFPQPNAADRKGFYVCVAPNGRIAEINLLGRIQKAYNTSAQPYKVSSKVFARPNDIAIGAIGSDLFSVPGGVLTFSQPVALKFKVIGSSISCGAGGRSIPVTTKLMINTDADATYEDEQLVDSSTPLNLNLGTTDKVVVRGNATASWCGGGINNTYDSNNTNQVFALRNGDPVPNFNAFGGQTTIKAHLQDYTDPVTNKISIANNEVIYLFELGSTDRTSTAFDSQDLVILASAEPR